MTSVAPERRERERLDEITRLRKQRAALLKMAEDGEIMENAAEHPVLKTVLLPFLESKIRSFQEHECWLYAGAELERAQVRAQAFQELRSYLLTIAATRKENLLRADVLGQKLEAAEKRGE